MGGGLGLGGGVHVAMGGDGCTEPLTTPCVVPSPLSQSWDMSGLTVAERSWRLFKVTSMLQCLFGDRYDHPDLMSTAKVRRALRL